MGRLSDWFLGLDNVKRSVGHPRNADELIREMREAGYDVDAPDAEHESRESAEKE